MQFLCRMLSPFTCTFTIEEFTTFGHEVVIANKHIRRTQCIAGQGSFLAFNSSGVFTVMYASLPNTSLIQPLCFLLTLLWVFFTLQKWHERYFLLRANKTIEIHKSRKAAETQKSPRKVIDLRECISLELGLEYKNLQHILSLGTFKRTFFLGAPSSALMLQWGNVLEKVKNAEPGMFIY